MMTDIPRRTLKSGLRRCFGAGDALALVFRKHMRLAMAALAMALVCAAIPTPPAVQSMSPPLINAPTNLVVTTAAGTSINLSWAAAAGAVSYRVERSESVYGPFLAVADTTSTTVADPTVTTLHAYLYRVCAKDSAGVFSAPSNMALGTAISFQFSQLQGQMITARHFHDVRTAINAVRAVADLPEAIWARKPLDLLDIKATDVEELRLKLHEALMALEIPVAAYEDPILSTGANGTPMKAIHIEQLQARSTRGSSVNSGPESDTAKVGEFGPVIQLPMVPVHLSVLPDRRLLFWSRDKSSDGSGNVTDVAGRSDAYVWNPSQGSNKTDIAVFRPSNGTWQIINSSDGSFRTATFGTNGDVPVPGDYDGDGKADLAVYRPSNGTWQILNSSNQPNEPPISLSGTPLPGDYDGDGKTDIAVFNPVENKWKIRRPDKTIREEPFPATFSGGIPVPRDYDNDRKTDLAIYKQTTAENNWLIKKSSTNSLDARFLGGINGDVPVPGDYNGDGIVDIAVYRPSDGTWQIRFPPNPNLVVINNDWGLVPTDIAAPGDYDGDGKTDLAVFRTSQGQWRIRQSSTPALRVVTLGSNGDITAPADYDGMLRVANSRTNLFCSGHSFLPDGRLFVAGGHQRPEFDGAGERHTNIFDYHTDTWSEGPTMGLGRWYPYNLTLGTGETLIVAGDYCTNCLPIPDPAPVQPVFDTNFVPEVYTAGGTLKKLNAPRKPLTFYPYLHLMPNDGKVLQVQSGFNVRNDPSTLDQESRTLNPTSDNVIWEVFGNTQLPHGMGSSVLYAGQNVLIVGGFDNTGTPTNGAESIDLGGPLTWTKKSSMTFPRAYHTATVLPDGKVLVTGGVKCKGGNNIVNDDERCSNGGVLIPEMWDPATDTWRRMAPHKEVRAYHSIAALLPDGRVLVGGGGLPGAVGERDNNDIVIDDIIQSHAKLFGHKNVEIYSPPYLFGSARPLITVPPPTSISYGQTFSVGTSGAGTQPKISLVRLPSVTHASNQDQRQIFLSDPVLTTGGLLVTAPTNPNVCPPGYYMLFVLRSEMDGEASRLVPSEAAIVRVLPPSSNPTISATMTSDNAYEFYFNGSLKGSGSAWWQSQTYSLPMQTGKNVLAIKATDEGGVAAFLAELTINGQRMGTSTSWKVSRTAPANWTDVNFDDSSWANATDYGPYGVSPWNFSIAGMPTDTPGRWIWSSNNDQDDVVFIRLSISTNSTMSATMTSDNAHEFYFNGSFQGSGSAWWQSQTYNLPMQIGKNVLAIRATDTGSVAGFLADLTINGKRLGSNVSWKVSRTAPANWTDVNFDDNGWSNATDYGPYGVSPWNFNVTGMPTDTFGRWIWSSNNDLDDLVFIRITFIS